MRPLAARLTPSGPREPCPPAWARRPADGPRVRFRAAVGWAAHRAVRRSRNPSPAMNPAIWAAAIAGGVSVVGNVATLWVARFGRDAQREQMDTSASIEVAKLAR